MDLEHESRHGGEVGYQDGRERGVRMGRIAAGQ
jgi:hypothetical protein